jgi:hypothetical protein
MTATSKPGTFTKGDPRINRKGRPKSFDAFRELAQAISHEEAKAGGGQLVINNHVVTVAEAILRTWAQSKDPRLQMAFIEVAFGKAPVRTEVTGKDGGKIEQDITHHGDAVIRKLLPELTAGRTKDQTGGAE